MFIFYQVNLDVILSIQILSLLNNYKSLAMQSSNGIAICNLCLILASTFI